MKKNLFISNVFLNIFCWIRKKSVIYQYVINNTAYSEQFVSQIEFTWQ
jgi:hypothetical protein